MNVNFRLPDLGRVTLPWRTIGIAAGGAVAVALLATGVWLWSAAQQQRGSAIYAQVLLRTHQSQLPQMTAEAKLAALNDLERVLAEYPSNVMAAEAAYEIANLRFSAGQYDKARAAWQVTIARASAGTLKTMARAGIGYAWEAERKLPEAMQAYEAVLADLKPGAFYYEETLLDLARVQEMSGQKDVATATYRKILKDLPKSVRSDEIRSRLASLGVTP